MPKMINGIITITNTGVRISPYTKGQCRYLENMTSITDKGYYGHKRNPITGFLIPSDDDNENEGTFVTHLQHPQFLKELFPNYRIEKEDISDMKALSRRFSLNPDITPREAQYQVIQQIFQNDRKTQWFVHLSQGLGKTLLSVYIIPYFNFKTLIMCYNTDVLYQWISTFREKTNIQNGSIIMIDSGDLLHKIEVGSFPAWEYDIFMCTPKLLTMYGKKHGFDKLDILMTRMGIGMKIFDEAHRNIANIIKINAYTSVRKTLYLSGDFAQSNPRKEELYYRIFRGVPILKPTQELMNTLRFTIAIAVHYNTHPNELEKTSVYTRRGFSFYDYMKYEIQKEEFFDALYFIIDHINEANENNDKILILLNLTEHVDIITERLEEKYNSRYVIGKYHSYLSDEEKTTTREHASMIISTHMSYGTGIDVHAIKYVISACVCTKIDDNQASGRARPMADGSDTFYFMMTDIGFDYVRKKLGERLEYLRNEKIKDVQELRLE